MSTSHPNRLYTTFIYAALPCEAKPLIDSFRLKKQLDIHPFAVYGNDTLCLTVTGVGKTAMAAAVAYTQALFGTTSPSVFLNIGIAGHQDYPLGKLLLVDKISDVDTARAHYPPVIIKTSLPRATLHTVSKPVNHYSEDTLYDMEASAFYETAARFSTSELIQCLKVVSDNTASPASQINAQQVTQLIAAHIDTFSVFLHALTELAEPLRIKEPPGWANLIQQVHFSSNELSQLKKQLTRWQVLTNQQALDISDQTFSSGKQVLQWLDKKLAAVEFRL